MVFTKHWEERRFSIKQKEAIEMRGAITCPQPVMRIRNVSQELWLLLGYSAGPGFPEVSFRLLANTHKIACYRAQV